MLITEALAEIKTVGKRIASKQAFIGQYMLRQDNVKDPLEKDGGSKQVLDQEFQAINDLEDRVVALRRGIAAANDKTSIKIEGMEKTITDWLLWRREVAPNKERFISSLRKNLNNVREQARRQGSSLFGANQQAEKPTDIIVNTDEKALAVAAETLEKILGDLDGQLSLKNATVSIN